VEREILVRRPESRFAGEEELSFRHALLREGAYATLTEADRALGHRLAGEWLEARGEQDARALATHFEKGGDGPAAGRHYLRAAQQASWGLDGLELAALARRGLALKLPGELRMGLLGALCETAIWQPDLSASVQREAEELMLAAPRGSAPWAQAVAARLSGAAVAGKMDGVLALVAELERVEVMPDAVYPMAITLSFAIHAFELSGRSPAREALIARHEAVSSAAGDQSTVAMSLFHVTMAACELRDGNPAGMLEHERKCRGLARQCGHRRMAGVAVVGMAMSIFALGAPEEAERMFRELSLSDIEFGAGSAYRPFTLAWLLADRGETGEARAVAMQLVTSGRDRGLLLDEGRGRWVLAEVLRRAGALEEAEREVEAALALLDRVCPADVSGVLATKAAVLLAQGRPGEALAAAEEGVSRQAAMGLYDQFFRGSFVKLVHVESLQESGRHDEARAALASARARLLAIAAKIKEPAYQKSFLENVPENRRIFDLARQWLGEGGEAESLPRGAHAHASPIAAG
jgi:hypothetical protein